MSVLTKKRGLKAIEQAGGVAAATFTLREGYAYPIARGHRIAETNRHLKDGPLTGAELFADLESRNWLLPKARRRYRPGEFREHLKYMVENGRLHVLAGTDPSTRTIQPTHENLMSDRATKPLTVWLIQAARQRGTMTYGRAKGRLESECGFEAVFTVAVGRVAGAAMNKILEVVPDAPLLNVLLVQAGTRLPGSGAVQYLADRYPGRRWLRNEDAHKDNRWRDLIEKEAARVYGYKHWDTVYQQIYDTPLPALNESPEWKERHGKRRGGGGEGPNHKALRLRVTKEPSLVRRGLRPENTDTEVELLSGDRVDVVSASNDGTVAIEVKSRDSDVNDVERGVYQCVKYRAVLEAQDIRRKPIVESWLVTETPLPGELKALARRLKVRTKVIKPE